MTTGALGTRLEAMTRELRAQWELTKDSWRDSKAQEFEQKYIQELVSEIETAVAITRQLDKLITKTRSDCE